MEVHKQQSGNLLGRKFASVVKNPAILIATRSHGSLPHLQSGALQKKGLHTAMVHGRALQHNRFELPEGIIKRRQRSFDLLTSN